MSLPIGHKSNPESGYDGLYADIQEAFIFHAVCWDELCGFFGPAGPDLKRLYAACIHDDYTPRRFPFSVDGILLLTSSPPRPSMRRIWKLRSQCPNRAESSWVQTTHLKLLALRYILELKHQGRCKGRCTRILRLSYTQFPPPDSSGCPDIFSRLPVEIRGEIARYLSTTDFFALRLASRNMACLFEDQNFWKSRFFQTDERPGVDLIFRQQGISTRGPIDWRALYRYRPCHVEHLQRAAYGQMKRWQNNTWLRERTLSAPGHLPSLRDFMAGKCDASANCPYKCRNTLSRESVMLPQHDVEVAVWVSGDDVGERTYVAGLAISSPDQPTTYVGYRLAQEPVRLRVPTLQWINVASHDDDSGIAGIAIANTEPTEPWSELTWAGQHEGMTVVTHATVSRYLVVHCLVGEASLWCA
ncbi:predicted protein [Aspergillus terreus NIH2624]|uniref:F-box domain-containing protein n=1 Tax=Aspergillus terreus (strain NIH 2624 / FGSC A1156) TaxID=341663 RepID=Q0CSB7_ASPTN|nr:uncharacterized protein ATEG_03417 [Aspergillus terreus NIH2624]EAU36691.1 predicted protein [Aspergillus terreus NIH2624]